MDGHFTAGVGEQHTGKPFTKKVIRKFIQEILAETLIKKKK
jgi:hypothetical protein